MLACVNVIICVRCHILHVRTLSSRDDVSTACHRVNYVQKIIKKYMFMSSVVCLFFAT